MKIYSASLTVPNTNITSCFIFTDNQWAEDPPSYQETGYSFATADAAMKKLDEMFGTSAWRRAPQARYNRGNDQPTLEFLVPIIEQAWSGSTSFEALDTVYTDYTVFAQSATFEGNIKLINSAASSNTTGSICNITSGSPMSYTIQSAPGTLYFYVTVLPEYAVSGGRLTLNTDMPIVSVILRIMNVGSNWQLNVYPGSIGTVSQDMVNKFNDTPVTDTDTDPYTGDDGTDDESGTGGGGSGDDQDNYDPDSDPNPVPGLPSLSAVDTGFITLYNPTAYELKNLASYMWSDLFDLDTYRRIMADPMDAILGLSIVPVNVPSSGQQAVTVGNISTGISMIKASAQYVSLDCGTVKISEKWHAYTDYSPYTKLSIFLPYIGSHELNIDEVQGTTLGVVYHIDILSGACVAFITANGRVIYEYSGQCSVSIPITAHDFTQTIMALGQLAASGAAGAITTIASGGLSAPVSASMIAGGITAAANTANNVIANKPRVSQSGNMSGSNGLLGIQIPYIFLERPRLCVPSSQNAFTGYPAYITYTLGSLSGFTQVQDVKLNNVGCTDEERNEILTLLREGVIL